MRAGRMFQQACIAKFSTGEKILALQVSSAISPATKTIELLLIFLRRLAGRAPQGFANTVRWDSDDRESACCGIGHDFRRAIQEPRPSAKDPVFEAAHLNAALDSSSPSDTAVENRVPSLDDIQLSVGQ